ncbi:YphA family membrane protein [Salsuginibacillus kocurii]|uniref:YphA family membrane protein n=1 Tax=Salsuginibacillus kocurii TaxID=427078 RepID=UPI0003703540|nr:hypothetical protein [Salsuginibacillus kocurii]
MLEVYGGLWFFWLVITFFWRKTKLRVQAAAIVLILISLTDIFITFGVYSINMFWLAVVALSACWLSNHTWKKRLYIIVYTLTAAMLYTSLHLMKWYQPVVFFIDKTWIIALAVTLLISYGFSSWENKVLVAGLGLSWGEWLTQLTLFRFQQEFLAGSESYKTILMLSLFVLAAAWLLYKLIRMLYRKVSISSAHPPLAEKKFPF